MNPSKTMPLSIFKTLIPFLSPSPATIALLLILATANTAQSQTTAFEYIFDGRRPTTLTYQGDAHFAPDTTFLQLIKTDEYGYAQPYSAGRALYSDPILFWEQDAYPDFETTVKFIIRPNPDSNITADGVAFFIAPVGTTIPPGSAGANFGIFDPKTGIQPGVFAAEFDIHVNGWDPPFPHIGIDLESRKSAAVKQIPPSFIGEEVTLRVNYQGATGNISVAATANSDRIEVSYAYDLRNILTQQVQVGIAGATGEHVAIEEVVEWSFRLTIFDSGESHIRQFV